VLERQEAITTWVVDDTGFLKQGSHSVGVQRQYTGSAGKVTNCQIGVSLAIATSTNHLPLDFELYLPSNWATDPALREEARIPDGVTFKTKIELSLEMIERAALAKVPGEIILADGAYGSSSDFRNGVRVLGFDFAVGIQSNARVLRLDARDRSCGEICTAAELAASLGRKAFRRVTWRQGSKSRLTSRFCFVRVKTMHDDGIQLADREPVWLVMEWLDGEERATKFTLTTLSRRMSRKAIVRLFKERWRTERMYEDLKGELGLDHFEGRSYPAWHHHISVVLCCYAFIVAEQSRAFSPSAGGAREGRSVVVAA
jgi:SRSO17 transposase